MMVFSVSRAKPVPTCVAAGWMRREGQHMRPSSLLELSAADQALAQTTEDRRFDRRKPEFKGS